jgi:hypothetical protein
MDGAILKAGSPPLIATSSRAMTLEMLHPWAYYQHTHNIINTKVSQKPNKKQHLYDMKKVGEKTIYEEHHPKGKR